MELRQPPRCWPSIRKETGESQPSRMPPGNENEQGWGGERQPTMADLSRLAAHRGLGSRDSRFLMPTGLAVTPAGISADVLQSHKSWEPVVPQRPHDPNHLLQIASLVSQSNTAFLKMYLPHSLVICGIIYCRPNMCSAQPGMGSVGVRHRVLPWIHLHSLGGGKATTGAITRILEDGIKC